MITVAEFHHGIRDYLDVCKHTKSNVTFRTYRNYIWKFYDFIADYTVIENLDDLSFNSYRTTYITPELILEYEMYLRKRLYSSSTIYSGIRIVKHYIDWLIKNRKIPGAENPIKKEHISLLKKIATMPCYGDGYCMITSCTDCKFRKEKN